MNDFREFQKQYNNYLMHHGILGMHWGIRRYQNPDGSLTEAGKKRYPSRMKKEEKLDRQLLRENEYRKNYQKAKRDKEEKLIRSGSFKEDREIRKEFKDKKKQLYKALKEQAKKDLEEIKKSKDFKESAAKYEKIHKKTVKELGKSYDLKRTELKIHNFLNAYNKAGVTISAIGAGAATALAIANPALIPVVMTQALPAALATAICVPLIRADRDAGRITGQTANRTMLIAEEMKRY